MAMLFNSREAEERQRQRYLDEHIRRQMDAMKRDMEKQCGLTDYEHQVGIAGHYVSAPQNAQDPLIKRNKKLLLLTT